MHVTTALAVDQALTKENLSMRDLRVLASMTADDTKANKGQTLGDLIAATALNKATVLRALVALSSRETPLAEKLQPGNHFTVTYRRTRVGGKLLATLDKLKIPGAPAAQ